MSTRSLRALAAFASLAVAAPLLALSCAPAAPPPQPPPAPAPAPGPATSAAPAAGEAPAAVRVEKDDVHTTASGVQVPLPAGWFFTKAPRYLLLEDPERELKLALVEVQGSSAAAAVAQAWTTALPGSSRPVERTLTPPPQAGLDEIAVVNYQMPTGEGRVAQAIAKRKGDRVVVALLDGAVGAVDRREAQIDVVVGGLALPGAKEESYRDAPARAVEGEILKSLDAFIAAAVDRTRVPGAAVAVVQKGKVVFEKGYGVREVGKKDPVTPETLMLIGSTTKSMTSLLMAALVDEGRFGWDTPAAQVMPDFALGDPEMTKKLQMKHLVCACVGMPRKDMELVFEFEKVTPEGLLAGMRSLKPTTGFGETFQYSNQMVAAAGYIAARAFDPKRPVGAAYDAAMQAKVFGPIGMKSTTLDFDRGLRAKDHATPHGRDLKLTHHPVPAKVERFVVPVRPSGGVWSNARDLSRYLLTELARGKSPDGKQVASEANFTKRWERQVATSDKGHYGLGWGVDEDRGVRVVQHSGGTMGFNAQLAFWPDRDLGLVILTNTTGGGAFIRAVQGRLFELVFGAKEEAQGKMEFALKALAENAAKEAARMDTPADSAWIAPWVGTWQEPDLGTIKLSVDKGGARLDAGEWASAVGRKRAPDGAAMLMLTDPPAAGLELIMREKDGKRSLVVEWPQHDYVFELAGKK